MCYYMKAKAKYDIVIVDSGVNFNHPAIKDNIIDGCSIQFLPDNKFEIIDDFGDEIGHGTAVYYLIKRSCKKAKIFVFKLFNKSFNISLNEYCLALEYLYHNLDFKILHLSNGLSVCEDIPRLKKICNDLNKKHTIIVSSFDNGGAISYPASFDNVIGVDWSLSCTHIHDFEFVEFSPINLRGIGSEQHVPWLGMMYNKVNGSSFSSPHLTSIIFDLIYGNDIDYLEVLKLLKPKAKKIFSDNNTEKSFINKQNSFFEIYKAVLFPFNKEMHSLVRFSEMLIFSLEDVYDIKELNNIGKETNKLLNTDLDNNYIVKNISKLDWSLEFDCFILGHVRELSEVKGFDYIKFVLNCCIKNRKNIYAFDNLSKYPDELSEMSKLGLKYFFPEVTDVDVPINRFGKLRKFSIPIISIMGTSSRQGKFTLQLYLRDLFIKNNYKVGQLGSEPSSLLFGMDEVYPVGYDSTVSIHGYPSISMFNDFLGRIEDKSPEIILIGTQSHSLHPSTGNVAFYPIYNHEILLAADPDAIILCVNMTDDIDYIRRTITFLENYQFSKVIALVIYPVIKDMRWSVLGIKKGEVNNSKTVEFKQFLIKHFNLPVFVLGKQDDMLNLYNEAVDYFSS